MLALARGEGQSIIIDGRIEVKIVKWSRSSVRIAIQAPREVAVDRDEIWRKMHPNEPTPLEKAEQERNERIAQAGGVPPPPGPNSFKPKPIQSQPPSRKCPHCGKDLDSPGSPPTPESGPEAGAS
jgi:carbon storage regulator CsrA